MISVLTLLFSLSSHVWAANSSEAFHITFLDTVVRVVAPTTFHADISVLIENNMSTKILGKIVRREGSVIAYLSVPSNSSTSVPLDLKKNDRIFFVPQSPAMQAVELIIGKEAYEIPPKKWSR